MGAALSFYSLFAIGPVLLIVIRVAGTFVGPDIVKAHMLAQMRDLLGDPGRSDLGRAAPSMYGWARS